MDSLHITVTVEVLREGKPIVTGQGERRFSLGQSVIDTTINVVEFVNGIIQDALLRFVKER